MTNDLSAIRTMRLGNPFNGAIMTSIIRLSIGLTLLACGMVPVAAQQLPPLRPLGPVLNTSTAPLASVAQVRALPDGRVIVHDLTGRRVVLFDSTFTHMTVIADSTSATGNAYSSRLGGLIAYTGDSTLFVDPQSLSMLVIDPNGKIVHTIAAPLPKDVNQLIGGQNGTPGFDAQGRLVYRALIRPRAPIAPPAPGEILMPQPPESSLVVRVNLKTRRVDTVATFRIPKITFTMTRDANTGNVEITSTANPMPWTDDWALLADGTLAIVRGQDYRVDLVTADGKMTSGPKLPFDWQRLSDDDKQAILDSTRTALERLRARMLAQQQQAAGLDPKASADTGKTRARLLPQPDGSGASINGNGRSGGRGGDPGAVAYAGSAPPPVHLISVSEMPDYRPAFRQGASRGDADGNLWIRTSRVVNGATEYDVINTSGELTGRILVPPGRVIAGFGPGGMVYMGVLDGDVARVERARRK
jgi:hypothetical protein